MVRLATLFSALAAILARAALAVSLTGSPATASLAPRLDAIDLQISEMQSRSARPEPGASTRAGPGLLTPLRPRLSQRELRAPFGYPHATAHAQRARRPDPATQLRLARGQRAAGRPGSASRHRRRRQGLTTDLRVIP